MGPGGHDPDGRALDSVELYDVAADSWIQGEKDENAGSRAFVIFHFKGLASYCKAETTFTFHFSIINALESI